MACHQKRQYFRIPQYWKTLVQNSVTRDMTVRHYRALIKASCRTRLDTTTEVLLRNSKSGHHDTASGHRHCKDALIRIGSESTPLPQSANDAVCPSAQLLLHVLQSRVDCLPDAAAAFFAMLLASTNIAPSPLADVLLAMTARRKLLQFGPVHHALAEIVNSRTDRSPAAVEQRAKHLALINACAAHDRQPTQYAARYAPIDNHHFKSNPCKAVTVRAHLASPFTSPSIRNTSSPLALASQCSFEPPPARWR